VALVNLIANSRDAMQSKGAIVIRTSNRHLNGRAAGGADADHHVAARVVCVSVEDDGPGMAEHVRERLFEPFFTTKGEAGHGFGLSQIYGFMRQAEGDIRIDSTPGEGTKVHLSFLAFEEPTVPPASHD